MKLSLPALLLLSVFSPCFAAEDVHNVESLKTSFNNAPVGTELQLNVTQNIGAAADSDFLHNQGANIKISSDNKASINVTGGSCVLQSDANADTTFTGLGEVSFIRGAETSASESAVKMANGSTLSFIHNDRLYFRNNITQSASGAMYGGILHATNAVGNISFDKNGSVIIDSNRLNNYSGSSATTRGGAIAIEHGSNSTPVSTLSFSKNGSVSISNNSINGSGNSSGGGPTGQGGAIFLGKRHNLDISGNTGSVSISGNKIETHNSAEGGAVYANAALINIDNNTGEVIISQNSVENTSETLGNVSGGAFKTLTYGEGYTTSISNNTGEYGVSICQNYAKTAKGSAQGGAFHTANTTLINNNSGGVSICNNYVWSTSTKASDSGNVNGGAFYVEGNYTQKGAELAICNNGTVEISGNFVASDKEGYSYIGGGALYVDGALRIEGNGDVIFKDNYVRTGNSVRLNSIERNNSYSHTDPQFILAAKTGSKIEFQDAIRINNSHATRQTASLNASYKDAQGNEQTAGGSIIFSGKNTETALQRIKTSLVEAGIIKDASISDAELIDSQTSTLQADVTLYAGTLSIEEMACLKTYNTTVKSGARLEMRNGTLNTEGAALTLDSDSSAYFSGANTLKTTSLFMGFGGTFSATLKLSELNRSQAVLSLNDAEMLKYGSGTVTFEGLSTLKSGTYQLLDLSGSTNLYLEELTDDYIQLYGLGSQDYFEWQDRVLCLVHQNIPEPTTTSLALLALSGVVMRRRRK